MALTANQPWKWTVPFTLGGDRRSTQTGSGALAKVRESFSVGVRSRLAVDVR